MIFIHPDKEMYVKAVDFMNVEKKKNKKKKEMS